MNEKKDITITDHETDSRECGDQNHKYYCNHVLPNELTDYDIKLLRSMKGFSRTMILWIISKENIHGYEIMNKLNQINPAVNDKVTGGPGSIYPILHDLEESGRIRGTWESNGKRKIKYYEITQDGINTLENISNVLRCHKTPILREFWQYMFLNDK